MGKVARTLCSHCDHPNDAGRALCSKCGCPTQWATHEQRTAWDLAWYRERNKTVPLRAAYDTPPRSAAPSPFEPQARRGIGSFLSRRGPGFPGTTRPTGIERRWVQAPVRMPVRMPAPVSGGAPTATAVAIERAEVLRQAPRPLAAVKQAPPVATNGGVRLREMPPMVLAVRLLNGRVSEIDSRLTTVERAIAERLPLKRRRLWK